MSSRVTDQNDDMRQLVLAAVMLNSLVSDLARLRRANLWQTHPAEMRKHRDYHTECGKIVAGRHKTDLRPVEWTETPQIILAELESRKLKLLFDVIASATNGRIMLSRRFVVRLAAIRSKTTRWDG